MANHNTGIARQNVEGRPWVRLALMKELAIGDKTQKALGEQFGCTRETVNKFKRKHEDEIADIRTRMGEEFAGILISQKANRLIMYQEMIDRAFEAKNDKLVAQCLRQVAEEMGHLPSRMQISGAVDVHTSYTIQGEDGTPINLGVLR